MRLIITSSVQESEEIHMEVTADEHGLREGDDGQLLATLKLSGHADVELCDRDYTLDAIELLNELKGLVKSRKARVHELLAAIEEKLSSQRNAITGSVSLDVSVEVSDG